MAAHFRVAQRAEQHAHYGRREKITGPKNTCLVFDLVNDVRDRDSLGAVWRGTPAEGHGLKINAANNIAVLNSEPDNIANLVVIHAFDDSGHEHDRGFWPGCAVVFDRPELNVEQVSPS